MPTYNSTGIGASLVVSELTGTLCDEIQFRMGSGQREDAERIRLQLLNGCKLQERPIGQHHSTVGVLRFVGDERDMALFVVEAGEPEQVQNEPRDHSLANVETPSVTATTFTSQSSTDVTTTPKHIAAQVASGRKKKSGNNKRSKSHNQTAVNTTTPEQKQSQGHAITFDKPLALSLKVECGDFIRSEDLRGKDLKIEIFLNGQLVNVTFESLRHAKVRGDPLYSGKRFHRQAEKPWVYVPGTASGNSRGLATERWNNINFALEQEASQRGMDKTSHRPISAQFLITLARMQLPDSISAKSGNFAILDVIVTVGKGRKYGAETSYITAPTRLFDGKFSGIAPVEDDFGQFPDPNGYMTTQDAFTHMPFGDPGLSNFQSSDFLDTQTQPSALLAAQYPVYPELQMPPPPPSPRTPRPVCKRTETYRKVLGGTPIKKLLSNYEDAHGHIKGRRTLKQRLGDMSKMSPKKKIETMNELKEELDEETMNAIQRAFEIDSLNPTTPTRKKVQFKSEVFDLSPVSDGEDDAEIIFGRSNNTANTVDPYNFNYAVPPPQPSSLNYGSAFSPTPCVYPETLPLDQMILQSSPSERLFPPHHTMMHFPTQNFGPPQQTTMQPSPSQTSPPLQQTRTQPSPAERSFPPTTPTKRTPASALSTSAIHVPVKKWPSQLRRDALAALSDDGHDENNGGQQAPNPPVPFSGAPTTPQAQRVGRGSHRNSTAWLPKEQKSDQALRDFQVPDLCVGSAVSYADGLQQRQVTKARGGEFEEQQFVVGMRFIVL